MTVKTRHKATIYDIAQLAGNSPSTVSYALNGTWKQRRIKPETVEKIKKIASENGYQVNLQARNLRKATSGLLGMILPEHDTRFFAELSQAFALNVRQREACPAIVLSGRGSEGQIESTRSLISYNVDAIVIAGATDPLPLSRICREAKVPHVFVDHASPDAPSVTTDSTKGAQELTRAMFARADKLRLDPKSQTYFLGGDAYLPSTRERALGFTKAASAAHVPILDDRIITCGYSSDSAERALTELYDARGALPSLLFVNSIICFEGVVRFLAQLPEREIERCVLGCFDYDPFVPLMRFPVLMMRQRADLLISEAFAKLDSGSSEVSLSYVAPDLIFDRA